MPTASSAMQSVSEMCKKEVRNFPRMCRDGAPRPLLDRAGNEPAAAGCFQPVAAIALDQTDDADRGPESLLRVRALAHDGLDQGFAGPHRTPRTDQASERMKVQEPAMKAATDA